VEGGYGNARLTNKKSRASVKEGGGGRRLSKRANLPPKVPRGGKWGSGGEDQDWKRVNGDLRKGKGFTRRFTYRGL